MSAYKILIVEDDAPIAELLAYRLRKEGYDTGIAGTGAKALQLAAGVHPDLILLDWQLPDISGLEVCRRVNEELHIPVIMVTARNMVEDKVLGLEAGADDYITKPFDVREVVARIKATFRRLEKTLPDALPVALPLHKEQGDVGPAAPCRPPAPPGQTHRTSEAGRGSSPHGCSD